MCSRRCITSHAVHIGLSEGVFPDRGSFQAIEARLKTHESMDEDNKEEAAAAAAAGAIQRHTTTTAAVSLTNKPPTADNHGIWRTADVLKHHRHKLKPDSPITFNASESLTAASMLARTSLSRGITALHLCKNVTLYMNELASPASGGQTLASEEHKPLMVMLPWLGSRPQAVAKYCEIYFRTGFDVLVVESEVQHFLWPRWGLEHGKKLLELLQSERFVSRPLLVHAFSIGGYTFTQLLVHVSQDTLKYQSLTKRIKGQVFDSLVVGSVEMMATGLGKTICPCLETLVKNVSLLYFGMFKQQTLDYYNTSIDVFWNTSIPAPSLFFFCENDPLSDAQTTMELIDFWRKRGINVTPKKWEDSTHAGHLKRHPQEYMTALELFLCSLNITPLKSKM
nr:PREDICTED: transmembrane protein 53-A-like isoform X2 [Paralichthys olivaceus]